MGSVYLRQGSKKYWIKYVQHGRVVRETTGTESITEARRMLRNREGDVAKGLPINPRVGRITFDEAVADLVNDYKTNGKRSLDDAERRITKHLAPYFGNRRLTTITTADLRAYIAKRQKDGYIVRRRTTLPDGRPGRRDEHREVSASEINRELTLLKRMFSLAIQAGKLLHKPHFPMMREHNVRTGFFEHEQYVAVLKHLPEGMRGVVTFAYVTGWRINSEILPLEWRQVDLRGSEVRLDPGTTKNLEGRVFYLTPELLRLMTAQRALADRIQRQRGIIVQHVFFHVIPMKNGDAGLRSGQPISEHGFYKAWRRAARLAGCPGTIPHDFRRTAIRNMVRAGIPERVAMKLSGHKTRSVFDRYNIVSDGDLREAAVRLSR